MNKSLLILSSLLVIYSSNFLFAQENIGIPPSPTVASLVTVEKDEANNAGQISQTVSLWQIKLGEKSFPINLTYSSSGVKVEEIPSYVGTGWNLSAGGVITRSVIDLPDDIDDGLHGKGILHTNLLSEIDNHYNTINSQGYVESTSKDFFKQKINENNLDTRNDTQPDIFYYNFFGVNGQFVFDKNKNIVSLNNDNFKFEHELDTDGTLKSFTITDTEGVKYVFSEREYSQTHYNSDSQWEFLSSRAKRQRQLDYYSSWHLQSVTTPTNWGMQFQYDNETISYQIKNSEMGKICIDQQCEDTNISDTSYYDILNNTASSSTDFIINSKKVKLITADNFNIEFDNNTREDLNGGLKLNQIKVKDINNKDIKTIDFSYSYFNSSNMPGTENYEYKRLKLNEIKDNNDILQSFEYYQDTPLPHRKSTEQDFWGYFNNNNANSLVPKIYTTFNGQHPEYHIFPPINETVVYQYGSIDRNTNPNFVHMGMLKKITYQTGGYKTFYYQPNDFTLETYTSGNSTIKGNGVRLDYIEYFDGKNTETLDYDYNSPITGISSGKVSHLPKFATHIPWNFVFNNVNGTRYTSPKKNSKAVTYSVESNQYWDIINQTWAQTPPTVCYSYMGPITTWNYTPTNNANKYFAMTTRRFSSSQVNLATNISNPLIYEYVTIKEGTNGKKQYNYNILGALDHDIPVQYDEQKFNHKPSYITDYWQSNLDGDQYLGPPNCLAPTYPIGTETLQEFNDYTSYTDLSGNSHPFAPKPNWNRYFGTLKNTTYFNESGYKVYKESYNYDLVGDIINTNSDKKIISLKYRLFNRPIGFIASQNFGPTTGPTAWIWSFYDIYYNIGLVPTSISKTNYYNNETSSITNTTNNIYTRGNLLASSSIVDYRGDTHKTKFKYPFDFKLAPPYFNVYDEMVDKNMIYNQIEIINEVNNSVVSAQINEYERSGSLILFKERFQFENEDFSHDYSPAILLHPYTNSGELNKDSNMVSKISHDLFDTNNGNIRQQTQKGHDKKAIVWGYNNTLPVAIIEGASYSLVENWFSMAHNQNLTYLNTISNNDTDTSGENNLRTWLDHLRSSVYDNSNGNVKITTLTYDPLVGVTSMKDTKDYLSFYVYDSFDRLNFIKNKNEQVLEEYKYNYKREEIIANTTSSSTSITTGNSVTFSTNASGGTGNFNYQWTVTNSNINHTTTTNTGNFTVTASTNHMPNFTVTCKIIDTISGAEITTVPIQINVTAGYSALVVSNISITGSTNVTAGNYKTYNISATGGSGTLKYQWSKTNSQYTTNYPGTLATSITKRVDPADCTRFTIKCIVTDMITNEVIIKTIRMNVTNGCLENEKDGPDPQQ